MGTEADPFNVHQFLRRVKTTAFTCYAEQPPRGEEAASFSYMQHQPLRVWSRRLLFWYAEASGSMMQPPGREEAASFPYMQHQPLTVRWRRLLFWYAETSGFLDICCSLQGAKRLPLSLICSISLLQYNKEDCFFDMQRPRVSGICWSLQVEKRLPLSHIYSIILRRWRMLPFSYMQSLWNL